MKNCHPSIFLNDSVVEQSTSQIDLAIHLEEKLDLNAHIKVKISNIIP